MRVFLRVLLALGLCVLLAGTVLAADSDEEVSEISIRYTAPLPAFESLLPDRPEEADPEELTEREAQWMERAWAGRDRNARERLCLRLLEDGAPAAVREAAGSLEYVRCFSRGGWEELVWVQEAAGASPARSEARLEPADGPLTLQVRLFSVETAGGRRLCQSALLRDRLDRVLWQSASVRELPRDGSLSLRLELRRSGEREASPPDRDAEGDAPLRRERTWTYESSDGRPLWQVALGGCFLDGLCTEASGRVVLFDDAWVCAESRFFPEGTQAAALVTLQRRAMGIVVAERSFRLTLDGTDQAD